MKKYIFEPLEILNRPIIFVCILYFIYHDKFILFSRDDHRIGPLSGKVEKGESPIDAVVRESKEETNIQLDPGRINTTPHSFLAPSPKGKFIYGISFYVVLDPASFLPSQIKLNSELLGFEIFNFDKAVKYIERYGHSESINGIQCVLNQFWSDHHNKPYDKLKNKKCRKAAANVNCSSRLPWTNYR